jgi:hypothetical protein
VVQAIDQMIVLQSCVVWLALLRSVETAYASELPSSNNISRLPAALFISTFFELLMFTSTVTSDRCQLFYVEQTDLLTYDTCRVGGAPSDYMTAVYRARDIQETLDPEYEFYDYRVAMCS